MKSALRALVVEVLGGPIVSYAFGAIMGEVYGAIAEGIPETTFGPQRGAGCMFYHSHVRDERDPIPRLDCPEGFSPCPDSV